MRTICPTFNWPLSFSGMVKLANSTDRSVSDTICVPAVRILADLDLADAELAVERRAHQLLRDDGLGLGDAGIGLVE